MLNSTQTALFKTIENRIPAHQSLVDEITDVLGISRDSAYRRLRGDTELCMGELETLCLHYDLSLDALIHEKNGVLSFYRNPEPESPLTSNFVQGLQDLYRSLEQISRGSEQEIIYFCMELPVFHLIQVPELLAFKLHYWQSIEQDSVLQTPPVIIDQTEGMADLTYLLNRIIAMYIEIPGTEIIYHAALSSTLMQILVFLESGKFANPKDALRLIDQLQALVQHLKVQAQIGQKFRFGTEIPSVVGEGNFRLFHNEMIHSQNVALARADGNVSVYLEYNILNFLRTSDPAFCAQTQQTLTKIMRKSILISKVSEKERNKYFNLLVNDIVRVRNKVVMLLSDG